MRYAAQDLLFNLLQRDPSDRPKSFAAVLAHPFLSGGTAQLVQPPALPYRGYAMLSYQSTNERLLKRIRLGLNAAGISTVDGTQVPPGGDWRVFFFDSLAQSSLLVALESQSFWNSAACLAELTQTLELQKPLLKAVVSRETIVANRLEVVVANRSILDQVQICVPADTNSTFEDDFFTSLNTLISQMSPFLGINNGPHVALLFDVSDSAFAEKLKCKMEAVGLVVESLSNQAAPDKCTEQYWQGLCTAVVVPVLSAALVADSSLHTLVVFARKSGLRLLPVLLEAESTYWETTQQQSGKHVAHHRAIFAQAVSFPVSLLSCFPPTLLIPVLFLDRIAYLREVASTKILRQTVKH